MTDPFDPAIHRDRIEAALAYGGGTHSYDDIVQGLEDKRYQLWPGRHSTMVTEVLHFPRKRVAHCFLAAGDMAELLAIRTWGEAWARRMDLDAIMLQGRPGWERVLAVEGYAKQSVTLMKTLREGQ